MRRVVLTCLAVAAAIVAMPAYVAMTQSYADPGMDSATWFDPLGEFDVDIDA